jgi:hypothetical protein
MYTLGKTIHTTVRAAIAATALLLFASCANPLTDAAPDKMPDAPVGAAPNRVTLSIATTPDASRIVLPDASPLASYRLFGSFAGGALSELGTWTSLTAATVTVASGEWDFTLDGYDGDGVLILTSSIDDRNVTEGMTLSFSLRDIESGTGSVSVNLLWPYVDNLVTSVTAIFDETTTTLTRGTAPSGEFMVTYSDASVAAGDYLLTFRMLDSDGMTVATVTEWVLVRKGLASKKDIALASTDLNYVPAMPGNSGTIDEGLLGWSSLSFTLAWSDSSDNETGFLVESSEDGETWVTETSVGAGVRTYPTSFQRGESRSYRISAFNDFGFSEPATTDYEVPALIELMTSDSEIMTVTVNLWEPDTLAFHGTFEFTRCGSFFKGGGEPTTLGPQLIQAYAYDAEGKIRGVAEATETIDEITDKVTMIIQPARLIGGNVQKTGVTGIKSLYQIPGDEVGIDYRLVTGMACDGLNVYIAESVNFSIRRRVISSGLTVTFAGNGAGRDEDNPGYAPVYHFEIANAGGLTTDGKQLFLADLDSDWNALIVSISYTASSHKYVQTLAPYYILPAHLTVEGNYLYVGDWTLYRIEMSNLAIEPLNHETGIWGVSSGGDYNRGGITSDGMNMYWQQRLQTNADGTVCSMPLGGGSITQHSTLEQLGGGGDIITDGIYLYYAYYNQLVGNLYQTMNIATGEKSSFTNLGNGINSSTQLTTDGESVFYVPSTRVP